MSKLYYGPNLLLPKLDICEFLSPVMAPKSAAAHHKSSLLALPEVGSWFKDHASSASAQTQFDQLELFCRRTGTDPLKLLAMARRRKTDLQALVQKYVLEQQAAGRSSRYALNTWWGIRAFLAYHGVAPTWVPKLKPIGEDDREGLETVPTTAQLRSLLNIVSPRGRAATLLMASSGIRVGVLATQFGPPDGLRIRHLPDLSLDGGPHFERTPFLVRVPSHLSKGSTVSRPRDYLTFGSGEAAEAIVAYLKERQARGEVLTPASALIAPDGRGRKSDRVSKDGMRLMARKALAFSIKSAMDRVKPAGVHWHAHTLRSWFSTQMETAESRGLISRSRREFFMGHSGRGADFVYNLDRPRSAQKIEELRSSYQKCESLLSTLPVEGEHQTLAKMQRVMLMGLGYTEEELSKVDVDSLDMATFQELVTKKVPSGGSRAQQRLADTDELPGLLKEGWRVVTAVNGHQVVLEPPSHR